MTAVPTMPLIAGGMRPDGDDWADIYASVFFLLNRPAAQYRQSATQTVATATFTSITFTAAEELDTDPSSTGGHSTSSNTSRFTAVYPGWYLCSGAVCFTLNATGMRGSRWAVNGSAVNASAILLPTHASNVVVVPLRSMLIFLNAADYVEPQGYQASGGNLDTFATGEYQSGVMHEWARNA